ncbi:MAG: FISUMP domain-containing protein, partial [Bacteroidota bacterium]
DNIPTGLNNSQWSSATSGAYAIYNNDPVNDGLYGKLYNHYAVTDSRGLCPTGWHVPSDAEWNILVKYLDPNADTVCGNCFQSSIAGGALKSTETQPTPGGWTSPNSGATNSSGFTALPGGLRLTTGGFSDIPDYGRWWSSSVSSGANAWLRDLHHSNSYFGRFANNRALGLSVRCLQNSLPQVNTTAIINVTHSTSVVTGNVLYEGDQNPLRGFCYDTLSNPTVTSNTAGSGSGGGEYTGVLQNLSPLTTYYVRAYATNSLGTSYGQELSFTTDSVPGVRCSGTPTVSDGDGNIYYTVQIGTQCWMQSNLKASKYQNGDSIFTSLSNSQWQNITTGAYSIYNNDPLNDGLFGKLYNHYAVTDSRGLCPTGWHVPTDGEWTVLEGFLGGSASAGGPLKSNSIQPTPGGWSSPNTGATNSTGFTATPGGLRLNSGEFNSFNTNGYWWSSSVSTGSAAWIRYLNFNDGVINRNLNLPTFGFSVRCLLDSNSGSSSAIAPTISTTTASSVTLTGATTGGNVSSDGGSAVTARGVAYATAQNPTTSNSTTSNGTGAGVFTSTLSGLTSSTVYYVRAYATNSVGTGYGNQVIFTTTFITLPSVITTTASSVTTTGAITGGNVNSDGGASVTARGVAYGTAQTPTISGTITNNGTGTGLFTSSLTGLTASTIYFVRAYATNSVGTAYGNEVSFTTTSITLPSVTVSTPKLQTV